MREVMEPSRRSCGSWAGGDARGREALHGLLEGRAAVGRRGPDGLPVPGVGGRGFARELRPVTLAMDTAVVAHSGEGALIPGCMEGSGSRRVASRRCRPSLGKRRVFLRQGPLTGLSRSWLARRCVLLEGFAKDTCEFGAPAFEGSSCFI
jgi:hypothetical protein